MRPLNRDLGLPKPTRDSERHEEATPVADARSEPGPQFDPLDHIETEEFGPFTQSLLGDSTGRLRRTGQAETPGRRH